MVAKKKSVKKFEKKARAKKPDFVRDFVDTTMKDPKRKAIIDSFYLHAAVVKHSVPSNTFEQFVRVAAMETINKIDGEFRKLGV